MTVPTMTRNVLLLIAPAYFAAAGQHSVRPARRTKFGGRLPHVQVIHTLCSCRSRGQVQRCPVPRRRTAQPGWCSGARVQPVHRRDEALRSLFREVEPPSS
jgi:hypothetical protein